MNIRRMSFVCLIVAMVFTGCASPTTHRIAINAISPAVPNLADCLLKQQSLNLTREGLAGDIMLIAALTEMAPKNLTFLSTAALAYTAQGLVVEDENKEYADEMYLIAKDYGMRALRKDSKFNKAFEANDTNAMVEAIKGLDEKYVPAMFWSAMGWGLYMFANLDKPEAPLGLPLVVAMVDRARELDPTYFFGAPHLFFVAYNGFVPVFMGGGLDKANDSFAKCLEVTDGDFLLARVYYAKFVAGPYNLEEEYDKQIQTILDAVTPSDKPELNLVNQIAKKKAQILLEKRGERF
jgi:hypothetical protein